MAMNTSQRTVAIAEGIWLYARYQNLPVVKTTQNQVDQQMEWENWAATKPSAWVEFVKKEQYDLFDRVNGLL